MIAKFVARISLVGLLLAASAVTAHAADTTVEMLSNNEFSPENVTVNVGDTVTWVNVDAAVHDSVARDPLVTWNTGFLDPNATATVRFDTVATYFYHCRIHPGMTGRVIVALAPPATDTVDPTGGPAAPGALAVIAAALLAALAVVRRTSARLGSRAGGPGPGA